MQRRSKISVAGIAFSSLWTLAAMQRLCSEKPPNDRDPRDCCLRLPNPIDSNLMQICNSKYLKNTQRQQQDVQANDIPKGNCVPECVANYTNIYRGNGLVDRVVIARLFLNSVSGDREWGDIVASTVNVCINETRMKADELRQSASMKATFAGEVLCNPISGYVLGCMNTELFRRCPNMTQSVECSALQRYSVGCHISMKTT